MAEVLNHVRETERCEAAAEEARRSADASGNLLHSVLLNRAAGVWDDLAAWHRRMAEQERADEDC